MGKIFLRLFIIICLIDLYSFVRAVDPPAEYNITITYGEEREIHVSGINIKWYSDHFLDERDGQIYKTIRFNGYTWLAENMNYYTSEGSTYYNNDSITYAETYGRLYNYTAAGEACPEGWRLPNWNDLSNYIGGPLSGGALKEKGTVHWSFPNIGATNESGFNALPAGIKPSDEADFKWIGEAAFFWSGSITFYYLKYDSDRLFLDKDLDIHYFSVRYLKEDDEPIHTGNSYNPGLLEPGIHTYYITQTVEGEERPASKVIITVLPSLPLTEDVTITYGDEIPELEAIGENIKWYGTWELEDERDGQSYKTTTINGVTWMAENLNFYTPEGSCYYGDSITYAETYGRLYNWVTANEVCPDGWRLPSDDDWKELEEYMGMPASELDEFGFRGTNEGGRLKSTGSEWMTPNTGATNEYGFSALPAGNGLCVDCMNLSHKAHFWTSTTFSEEGNGAVDRLLAYNNSWIERGEGDKMQVSSVRCILESSNLLAEGNIFILGVTEIGIYTFYVTQTINGVESRPQIVTLSILPDPPKSSYVSVCYPEDEPLLAAEGQNIKWYEAPPGYFLDKRDGQLYKTTRFNGYTWLAENMNYYTSEGSTYYNNDSITYAETYGRLYNYTAAGEACPEGWRLPNWNDLSNYIGGPLSGGALKEKGTVHWSFPNIGATNESGFNALPAGIRYREDDEFSGIGEIAYFWSGSTTFFYLMNDESRFENEKDVDEHLFSLRFLKEGGLEIHKGDTFYPGILELGLYTYYATQTVDDIESLADTVLLTINSLPDPPATEDMTICESPHIEPLYIEGSGVKWYQNLDTLVLVDERDGNAYDVVKIGTQWWMAENLNYGNRIDNTLDQANNEITEKYCYNNEEDSCDVYGGLYQWKELMDYKEFEINQGICPEGWHIPSDKEWRQLEMYLGMTVSESLGEQWRGTSEGGLLKEAGSDHWGSLNTGATNETGFTALPAGTLYFDNEFYNLGNMAYFWTSSTDSANFKWKRNLTSSEDRIRRMSADLNEAMSVRCIKDDSLLTEGNTFDVALTEPGSYQFYVLQTINNCESGLQELILTIKPKPDLPASDDESICFKESIPELYASGSNINWYADDSLISWLDSGNSYIPSAVDPGIYVYYATQTIDDCESLPDSVFLKINALPDVNMGLDTIITTNQELLLSVSDSKGYLYLWNTGSEESSVIISGKDIGVGDHSYWVRLTDSNSCIASDTIMVTVIDPTSIIQLPENQSVYIFPNPVTDRLNIYIDEEIGDICFKMINQSGEEVFNKNQKAFGEPVLLEINIEQFYKGIYYILMFGNDFKMTKQIIIK